MERLRINWVLPRVGLGGGDKSNRLLAEAMVRRGHEVSIAFLDTRRRWPMPWKVRSLARHMWQEWQRRGSPRHHFGKSTARLIPVTTDRIMPHHVPDADVTIGTWWETMEWIEGWPASKGLKAHFVRGYEVYAGNVDRVKAVYRIPCLKLVISSWLRNVLSREFGASDVILVPNGVDWAQFNSSPREKSSAPTVGFVYNRGRIKGADVAVEAIRLARKLVPNLRAVSFGAFPLARRHRLSNCAFTCNPKQSDIARIYSTADCWLIPSVTEGFGMPGLEAAACRCPVIATRCGGPEDYVRHGVNGYLVEVGAAREMADRIVDVVKLATTDWRRMSEASFTVAREFDWGRSAAILENALMSAIERNRPVATA